MIKDAKLFSSVVSSKGQGSLHSCHVSSLSDNHHQQCSTSFIQQPYQLVNISLQIKASLGEKFTFYTAGQEQ